jgi:hypothetical protein
LVRFYGAGAFHLPGWALDILYKCITPLRFEEATWATNSTRVAVRHRDSDYRQQMDRWHNLAAPVDEAAATAVINPAVEKWFIDNGIPYRLAADNAADE